MSPVKTLKFIEVAGAVVKMASDEIQIHRDAQKRAAGLRPEVLASLIDNNLIDKGQKDAAEAMLASHAETLQLLKSACDKLAAARMEKKAAAVEPGRPSDVKAGAAAGGGSEQHASLTSPFVGRRTSEKKASDEAICEILQRP